MFWDYNLYLSKSTWRPQNGTRTYFCRCIRYNEVGYKTDHQRQFPLRQEKHWPIAFTTKGRLYAQASLFKLAKEIYKKNSQVGGIYNYAVKREESPASRLWFPEKRIYTASWGQENLAFSCQKYTPWTLRIRFQGDNNIYLWFLECDEWLEILGPQKRSTLSARLQQSLVEHTRE